LPVPRWIQRPRQRRRLRAGLPSLTDRGAPPLRAGLPSLTDRGAAPQAENFFTAPQQRVFDVLFQGQAVLRRVDLVALVGARTAWQHTVPRFPVAGGRLNITFTNIVRHCLRLT